MPDPPRDTSHPIGQSLQSSYEPRPDPQALTGHADPSKNSSTGVDYEPNPSKSISVDATRQKIVQSICNLYSGSASEEDMQVYAAEAVYDDPWSYCDTRYKIAGQWYGIPKIFKSSKTLATEVVQSEDSLIVFKLRQEYCPKLLPTCKTVNSLVSLALDKDGKVKYHKDMWNEKDYSHEGLGRIMKELNGDHLTKITQPPERLAEGSGYNK